MMILGLALSSNFDPNFLYLGGSICLFSALISMVWMYFKDKEEFNDVKSRFDWDTVFFLMGIFIAVGLLEYTKVIDVISHWLKTMTGNNLFLSFTIIVWFSVFFSAFIDNVPFITVMLPIAARLGGTFGDEHSKILLMLGLLIGSCLGGNITPLGASANIVAMGLLKKNGHPATSWQYIKIGLPFTLTATFFGYIFLWLIWGK